jgi:hypothetical protein
MSIAQSERVREIVRSEYVERALAQKQKTFQVSARDVLHKAEENPDFPRARTPLICNVLQSKKLLEENDLKIERIDGPPSRQSRTVVVHYSFRNQAQSHPVAPPATRKMPAVSVETPEERAFRLTEKLRGLMKEEIAAYGGGEAYLRWVRGEDEGAA